MLQRLCVPLPIIMVVFMSPILSDENAFSGTCPTPSPIKPRDLNCLNNTVYHIVRDPRSGGYIERCFILNRILQGYATVMDKSGNLNTEACHEGTFQRHSYKSNTQCACKEAKGSCNKTGQLIASNGNTTHDRTCRCDFKRGYKFSIKPSNECFCQSSSEDCTCIKEECKTGYRLSPDYECVPENLYSCKDFITSEESTTESVPDSDISVSLESTTVSVPNNNRCIPEMMPTWTVDKFVTAIITFFCGLVLGVVLERKGHISGIWNKGKDSDPVQETGDELEDEVTNEQPPIEQPPIEDNYLETDILIKMPSVKIDELEDKVTYKLPLTDHS